MIERARRRHHYAQINRDAIEDRRLSLRAKGLLCWILAKPDNWRTDTAAIARAVKEGRDAVRTAMRELREAGYVELIRWKDPVTGQFEALNRVHECPIEPQPDSQAPDIQAPGNQRPGDQAPDSQAIKVTTQTKDEETPLPPTPPPPNDEPADPGVLIDLDDEERALGLERTRELLAARPPVPERLRRPGARPQIDAIDRIGALL